MIVCLLQVNTEDKKCEDDCKKDRNDCEKGAIDVSKSRFHQVTTFGSSISTNFNYQTGCCIR